MNKIDRKHKKDLAEFQKQKIKSGIKIKGKIQYYNNKLLTLFERYPEWGSQSPRDFIELNTKINILYDDFNHKIYTEFINQDNKILSLSADQTEEFFTLSNEKIIPIKIDNKKVINYLSKPYPDEPFGLYDFVYNEKVRNKIKIAVQDAIFQNLSKEKIIENLEKGMSYKQAENITDTELQRAYSTANYVDTLEFNKYSDEVLVIERSLSKVHPVQDICDECVGVYCMDKPFPAVPSHPSCICLTKRVFKDNKKCGKIGTGNIRKTQYFSKKYPKQTTPILKPSMFNY